MTKVLTKADLIGKFSESLGIDKATAMIEEVLSLMHLETKTFFTKEEVIEISKNLKLKGGFIGILASCLAAEAYHMPSAKPAS